MPALIPITLAEKIITHDDNGFPVERYIAHKKRAMRKDGGGRLQLDEDTEVGSWNSIFTVTWYPRNKRITEEWRVIDQWDRTYKIDAVIQVAWNRFDLRTTRQQFDDGEEVIEFTNIQPAQPTQLRVGWSHDPVFTPRLLLAKSKSSEIAIPQSSGGLYLGLWRAAMAPDTIFIGDELEDPDDTPLNVRGMFRDDPIAFSDLNQVAGELLVSVYRHKSTLLGEETLRVQ